MSFWSQKYSAFRELLYRQMLPGFKGISIAIILKYLWKEIWRDDIVTRANSMAFSFFYFHLPRITCVPGLASISAHWKYGHRFPQSLC